MLIPKHRLHPVSVSGGREHCRRPSPWRRPWGTAGGGLRPPAALPLAWRRLLLWHSQGRALGSRRVPSASSTRGALQNEPPANLVRILDHIHARPRLQPHLAAGGEPRNDNLSHTPHPPIKEGRHLFLGCIRVATKLNTCDRDVTVLQYFGNVVFLS